MATPADEVNGQTNVSEHSAPPPVDLESAVEAVESLKAATTSEPASVLRWLQYCQYLSSLEKNSQSWSEDERPLCQELFPDDTIEGAWQTALTATRYHLKDSHMLWNQWISRQEELGRPAEEIQEAFVERLQVPSAAWDGTASLYSTFLTKHLEDRYERAMIEITKLAAPAKTTYASREPWELKLNAARETEARKAVYAEYLDFENIQSRKEKAGHALQIALHERVLMEFPNEADLWEDYLTVLGNASKIQSEIALPELLDVVVRAIKHRPTSQSLWSRYLLLAEISGQNVTEIEGIMGEASKPENLLSIQEAVEIYTTWCGYLVRNSNISATGGIEAAIKNLQRFGEKDPTFALERILVEHLTTIGETDTARNTWIKLVKTHALSYEFWQQYYDWEMAVETQNAQRPLATAVLEKAINYRGVDWPEKLIETYARHCNLYLDALGLLNSKNEIQRVQKSIAKRRQREYAEQQAQYAAAVQPVSDTTMSGTANEAEQTTDTAVDGVETTGDNIEVDTSLAKRKRDGDEELHESNTSPQQKRAKSEHAVVDTQMVTAPSPAASHQSTEPQRDRENLSLLVTGLPAEITLTRVKQFFKGYGHVQDPINLIRGDASTNKPSTALVEFRTPEDVLTALLRDSKPFHNSDPVSVKPATRLTLFITNFPPSKDGDDAFIEEQFGKYGVYFPPRWPNKEKTELVKNQRRRFLYLSFTNAESAVAALELDEKEQMVDGNPYETFKMSVKISNPRVKKAREPRKRPPKVKDEEKPAEQHKQIADVDMTGVVTIPLTPAAKNTQNGSGTSSAVEKTADMSDGDGTAAAKPKNTTSTATSAPTFMVQTQVRRPMLGGGGKKKRGGMR